MLWENRDRYQIPTYDMAVDTVPSYASFIAGRCQLEKWESGTCPYFPTTESLLPLKAVHLEFQILLPTKHLHATKTTIFATHPIGT